MVNKKTPAKVKVNSIKDAVQSVDSVGDWKIGSGFLKELVKAMIEFTQQIKELAKAVNHNGALLNDIIAHTGYEVPKNEVSESEGAEKTEGKGE